MCIPRNNESHGVYNTGTDDAKLAQIMVKKSGGNYIRESSTFNLRRSPLSPKTTDVRCPVQGQAHGYRSHILQAHELSVRHTKSSRELTYTFAIPFNPNFMLSGWND